VQQVVQVLPSGPVLRALRVSLVLMVQLVLRVQMERLQEQVLRVLKEMLVLMETQVIPAQKAQKALKV